MEVKDLELSIWGKTISQIFIYVMIKTKVVISWLTRLFTKQVHCLFIVLFIGPFIDNIRVLRPVSLGGTGHEKNVVIGVCTPRRNGWGEYDRSKCFSPEQIYKMLLTKYINKRDLFCALV